MTAGVPLPNVSGVIYTVGLIEKYEAELDKGSAVKEVGGWVWRTREEAHAYLIARNSADIRRVYGILADWDRDVGPGYPRRLTRSATVVRL